MVRWTVRGYEGERYLRSPHPAGTGLRQWEKLIVGSKEDYERMQANKKNVLDFAEQEVGTEQQ